MSEQLTTQNPTTIFILGLLGILSCQILSPIAWYMGSAYKAECLELGIEQDGLGKAGYVLGIVGTVILGFLGLYIVGVFIFAFALIAGGV